MAYSLFDKFYFLCRKCSCLVVCLPHWLCDTTLRDALELIAHAVKVNLHGFEFVFDANDKWIMMMMMLMIG